MSLGGVPRQRLHIVLQGIVQGVGFRPFVYGQALRLGLAGYVLNNSDGVTIEIEGEPESLSRFRQALASEAPPLARIDSVVIAEVPARGEKTFAIVGSQSGMQRTALIAPDVATCEECVRELFDPANRRYRYPFINCTNCGPRFTIVQDVPYDRCNTTMRVFPMCDACRAEYDNPLDRRFHAQPNACPECGPTLEFIALGDDPAIQLSARGNPDSIELAAGRLVAGSILAIKGLGGYHLACDALNQTAVAALRRRKQREAKPFAVMVPDLQTAGAICETGSGEVELLGSRRRPIVLLRKTADCPVAPDVARGYTTLGVMLPYTPLHSLLLRRFEELTGSARPAALVMTSGNLSDEPIAYHDADAFARLGRIADGVLVHNRAIHGRCDDSVVRIAAGGEQIFRRARGYAPEPVPLAFQPVLPLLACGGHLKNTFALAKGRHSFISHHIGDLENLESFTSYREGIEHYRRLFEIEPQAVAYDFHPDYLATRYALESGIPRKIGVQHHHAHIASVLAEHALAGPVIGIAADGSGYGTDGAIWGCEIMAADLNAFTRIAHLAYMPLPGGEQAVRQPWRMAATYLARVYGDGLETLDIPFVHKLDPTRWRALAQIIARGIACPPTSSLGRLYDAVAALLGIRMEAVYEGQAAIELEMIAEPREDAYPFNIEEDTVSRLDVREMIAAIVEDIKAGIPVAQIAGRFHRSIAQMLTQGCLLAQRQTGVRDVALSGGVFQNRILLEQLVEHLEECGFNVYVNRRVPANDGGLSLGQLAVAAAQLRNSVYASSTERG